MKIAIYAIAKNEAKFVKDWIRHNSHGADYMVLVDTGSTDDTLKQFKDHAFGRLRGEPEYIAHQINVLPFRFDVARTTALALVPPDVDICISLDLDERLSPGWREAIERCWTAIPGQRPTRIWAKYQTEGLQPFFHDSRVHARWGYRWDHPCHECIVPMGLMQEQQYSSESLQITHHPDKTKPRGQYLDLLAMGIDERPDDPRRIFYYARELVITRHYQTAIGWLDRYQKIWEAKGKPEWEEARQALAMLTLARGALMETMVKGAEAAPALPTDQSTINDADFQDSLKRQADEERLRGIALGEITAPSIADQTTP